MDKMFTKYKDNFISSIQAMLDLLYDSKNLIDLKEGKSETIDPVKKKEILSNISRLEATLKNYKENHELTEEEQNVALAAMGTVIVHLEYLARCYQDAAAQAKIIIANVKSGS